MVRFYSKTQLTNASDKLIALSGVAEATATSNFIDSCHYLAGHWMEDLLLSLSWCIFDYGSRPESYRAPTWSWASVDGSVDFTFLLGKVLILANISSVQVDHLQESRVFGPVSGGYIDIDGPLLVFHLPHFANREILESNAFNLDFSDAKLEMLCCDSCVIFDDRQLYDDWPAAGKSLYYACLFVRKGKLPPDSKNSSEGLILDKIPGSNNKFVRVGWLRVYFKRPCENLLRKHKSTYRVY
jgi:hypothetical protein